MGSGDQAGTPPPEAQETQRSLVERARAGDAGAFACLVERHGAGLARFCRRLMREPGAAQDLAQETLLRAFQSLPRLEHAERFEAWLFGIAANLARWWWRRQARWPLSLDGLAEAYPDVPWTVAPWAGAVPAAPTAPSLEATVEAAEETRRLVAAVCALPPALGRVVVLHYLDGLSYAEIAAALDVPVSTVKGRLFKSRSRLRRALDPDGRLPRRPTTARRKETPPMTPTPAAPGQPAPPDLVPVTVESVHVAEGKSPRAVLLKEEAGERRLPIIIGHPEAEAISLVMQRHETPRPLTYDLAASLIDLGGLRLERVAISRLEGDTYFATLTLHDREGHPREIDARPSDAINLALRGGVPVLCAATLLGSGADARAFLERWTSPEGAPEGGAPPPGAPEGGATAGGTPDPGEGTGGGSRPE